MKNIFLTSALLIVGLLIGFNRLSNAQAPQQSAPPVKYEYLMVSTFEGGKNELRKLIIFNPDGTIQEKPLRDISYATKGFEENNITINNTLQELGNQEWELITISEELGRHRYNFKRIKR